MRWLPLIFICLLIYIEATIFVHVASAIGVLTTLILVVLTSCLGVSLVKNQGMKNVLQIQQKIAAGESPASEMIKSVALVLAGILLIIPGFFTDFLGLLLLLPPVQKLFVTRFLPHIRVFQSGSSFSSGRANPFQQGDTFEGEFQRKQDDPSYKLDQSNDPDKSEDNDKPKY
ncbi:FxsA family protein [Providencia sneebia]|uniref:Membrane protein FxsA n=1 Tax=Providencia sneebia DSM 19967 TaxID=1141660 RepID=K8WIV6_9GAMM|nr:FxsA family protein [Providencia sneebia]EKT59876.1 membrane protein FxsA [Providencia sneebia DSM 19967]